MERTLCLTLIMEKYTTCWLGKDEHLQFNHCMENLQILLEYL